MNESYCDATVMKGEGSRSASRPIMIKKKKGGLLFGDKLAVLIKITIYIESVKGKWNTHVYLIDPL